MHDNSESLGQPHSRPQSEPLNLTGVWQMQSTAQADSSLSGKKAGYVYRREGHPNATSLAESLRKQHQVEEAIVTAQGMSAISIAVLALLKPGDLVLMGQPLYGGTSSLIKNNLARWGIQHQDVFASDLDHWSTALDQPARMIILETITNPRLSVPDIRSIAALAHQKRGPATNDSGVVVLVDNTFATPALCQPIAFGADLVMESLSKFVCGHSDAMLGFLGGHTRVWDRIRQTMVSFGMTSSPLDCWLAQRGLVSLPVRMAHAAQSAQYLAQQYQSHPLIQNLDYPGLETHPDYAVAKRQFGSCFGNMLTFTLRGGTEAADRFIRAVADTIPFCPSLGEAQTTLSHPCSTSHRSYSQTALSALGINGGTIRLSVGLEPKEQLCEAISRGLN